MMALMNGEPEGNMKSEAEPFKHATFILIHLILHDKKAACNYEVKRKIYTALHFVHKCT